MTMKQYGILQLEVTDKLVQRQGSSENDCLMPHSSKQEVLPLLYFHPPITTLSVRNLIHMVIIYKEIRSTKEKQEARCHCRQQTHTLQDTPSLSSKFPYNITHYTIHVFPQSLSRQHSQLLPPIIKYPTMGLDSCCANLLLSLSHEYFRIS